MVSSRKTQPLPPKPIDTHIPAGYTLSTMSIENPAVSDEELMLRFKQGDSECFRELVLRHQKSIINLAFRITGNRQEAEEIAQEVFIRVYRAAARYRPKPRFSTYLYRITLNLALNQVRRAKVIVSHLFSGETSQEQRTETAERSDQTYGPLQTMEKEELKREVRKAIRSLPKRQRLAIILSQYQGLTYQEISDILHCSVKAVERLIHRGKIQLKDELSGLLK